MGVAIHKELIQRSIEWNEHRLGKMSGSKVASILDVKKKMKLKSKDVVLNSVACVISELETGFSDDSDYMSDAMEWGIENECAAIDILSEYFKGTYVAGGVTNSEFKYFWLSPDLLSETIGFEIKCFSSKVFAKCVIDDKIPSKHLPQALSYMTIMPKLECVKFVMYDPRFAKKKMHIITLNRSDYSEHISNMKESILEFEKLIEINILKFK